MVHALDEIRRVLVPGGSLLDLRPLSEGWPVQVASAREVKETGRVRHFPAEVDADRAAHAALKEAESRGWFGREQAESFPFFYSWDTPGEMEEFIADDWSDAIELDEQVKKATRAAWAIGDAESRVQVRVTISITRWRKLEPLA
jgi:hypothetical protein